MALFFIYILTISLFLLNLFLLLSSIDHSLVWMTYYLVLCCLLLYCTSWFCLVFAWLTFRLHLLTHLISYFSHPVLINDFSRYGYNVLKLTLVNAFVLILDLSLYTLTTWHTYIPVYVVDPHFLTFEICLYHYHCFLPCSLVLILSVSVWVNTPFSPYALLYVRTLGYYYLVSGIHTSV